jgi:hypothetical protein
MDIVVSLSQLRRFGLHCSTFGPIAISRGSIRTIIFPTIRSFRPLVEKGFNRLDPGEKWSHAFSKTSRQDAYSYYSRMAFSSMHTGAITVRKIRWDYPQVCKTTLRKSSFHLLQIGTVGQHYTQQQRREPPWISTIKAEGLLNRIVRLACETEFNARIHNSFTPNNWPVSSSLRCFASRTQPMFHSSALPCMYSCCVADECQRRKPHNDSAWVCSSKAKPERFESLAGMRVVITV